MTVMLMKRFMVLSSTTVFSLLLVLFPQISSAQYANGRCDHEFCACAVNVPTGASFTPGEVCPPWMEVSHPPSCSNVTYPEDSFYYGPAQVLCISYDPEFFDTTTYPTFKPYWQMLCGRLSEEGEEEDSVNNTNVIPEYYFRYLSLEFVLEEVVEYNRAHQPPECPWDPPETEAPTPTSTDGAFGGGRMELNALLLSGTFWSMIMVLYMMMWL